MDTFITYLDSFQPFSVRVTVIGGELLLNLKEQMFVGYQKHFFNKERSCFVCFCRLYVLL